ncbi:hypothetical protein SAMN05216198_2761 [Halopseudomonas litoralis]|uniref:Uncharacterized protein n=1 Tax=Halopseudomonas litoralis TaxID=797277 RepID=A0A1H1UZX6_9GAMM|nr:hypothetical protein [Halopseudomonas litoralis]SDS78077.1 hypothetical protein SAMN05216198_2761 [Halopseudomonas litoralis]
MLRQALAQNDDARLISRKQQMKATLFQLVADQTGKLFDPRVLTIVWARPFAAYKSADLLLHDLYRFCRLIQQTDQPVQIIWAGKPFPFDKFAIDMINRLIRLSYKSERFAVLTGYEIHLSRLLNSAAQDRADYLHWMNIIEHQVRPLYYQQHEHWLMLVKQGMGEMLPRFDSDRMADEYYRMMYDQ